MGIAPPVHHPSSDEEKDGILPYLNLLILSLMLTENQ